MNSLQKGHDILTHTSSMQLFNGTVLATTDSVCASVVMSYVDECLLH